MTGLDLPAPVVGASLVGSTAIYGSGADIDYVVLVTNAASWIDAAELKGWRIDGSYPGDDFTSLRKGSHNLIVTEHTWFKEAYDIATATMIRLSHVVPKEDKVKRVMLYELIKQWSKPHDA